MVDDLILMVAAANPRTQHRGVRSQRAGRRRHCARPGTDSGRSRARRGAADVVAAAASTPLRGGEQLFAAMRAAAYSARATFPREGACG